MSITFTILCQAADSSARAGVIATGHGDIHTPAFIPVATQGSVKGVSPRELLTLGAEVLLGNTYHLHLRPGEDLVARSGGFGTFVGWSGPTITDSGGFQAFSLGLGREQGVGKIASIFPHDTGQSRNINIGMESLARVDEEGISFRSHLDGSLQRLTPESSMAIQKAMGADIILPLDECTSPLSPFEYVRASMERTHRWALRCLEAVGDGNQALFGIVQGGEYQELREESAKFIGELPFKGLAIGGSLGKSKADMHRVLESTVPVLPYERPRHLLGIGEPEDILEGIERGIDLFDCASPTRIGRNGTVLTPLGRVNVLNSRFRTDPGPIQRDCGCYTCSNFSLAYLNHLFRAQDELSPVLCSIHNLNFTLDLAREARQAILDGQFLQFKTRFLAGYQRRAPKG